MSEKKIKSALVSVFHKEGLEEIIPLLAKEDIRIFSTGGTLKYLLEHGASPEKVEDLTGYPSILDGRVKTLHPAVFGGILARREDTHLSELQQYKLPEIDLVVVDLYPFEETVCNTDDETKIIEKIDIGGISLIRAAAKNYKDVVIIPSKNQYPKLKEILESGASSTLADRKKLAAQAFAISSHYDTAIFNYFNKDIGINNFRSSFNNGIGLRYGENPHQSASFVGNLSEVADQLSGKALSYNNLVDMDAAIQLMAEFENAAPTFAVIKHTNACGLATRDNVFDAWEAALAGDNVSAFGGILISNTKIDLKTASSINELFYELLIAPDFEQDALELLSKKKKRVLIRLSSFYRPKKQFKSLVNGVIIQDNDTKQESKNDLKVMSVTEASTGEIDDLLFANKLVKHIKSNTIVLIKNRQLVGMGSGQTSRVDACQQAILKAEKFGFDLNGAVMASDAFFPFPDCVELAHKAGIKAVIQPGGSINDQLSVDYCNENGVAMYATGTRHFKH